MDYNEKRRDSGSSFVTFVKKNYLGGELPPIHFIPKSLKTVLGTVDFSRKPLLLLVLSPESPAMEATMKEVCANQALVDLVNENFLATGILSTSNEIRSVLRFTTEATFPCIVVLRLLPSAGGPEIKVETLVLLSKKGGGPVKSENVLEEIQAYLKARSAEGLGKEKSESAHKRERVLLSERE